MMNRISAFPREEIDQTIGARFDAQASLFSDKVALQSPKSSVTYAALSRKSNALAHRIRSLQPSPGARVAFLLEHDVQAPIAMIAALKAGSVYVPLDQNFPEKRLRYMLADSQSGIIVTNERNLALARDLAGNGLQVLELDEIEDDEAESGLSAELSPDAMAYILYTSGSTGDPKGVVQSHRNVLHHARVWTEALQIDPEDHMTLVSPFSWDSAVQDMYGALLNGATSFAFDVKSEGFEALADAVLERHVSICHFTVPLARQVAGIWKERGDHPAVRAFCLGADMIHESDVELFASVLPEDCVYVNAYGSTESTTAIIYKIRKASRVPCHPLPIGYPVEDTEIHLLDEDGREVERGEVGEIAIQGAYVAHGYFGKPDLTAAKFEIDARDPRIRTYHTGDLGVELGDGCFALRGRRDNLVKVRGFRVELGEIEAALAEHPDVHAAVVKAFQRPSGDRRLAAYVVGEKGRELAVAELRGFLACRLPDFMIPAAFSLLDALPLMPNRKVDRAALAEPVWSLRAIAQAYIAPRSAAERQLAGIWQDVLEQEQIGIHDDFFELGGDSLAAMRMVVQAKKAGLALQVSQVFRHPTIEALAAVASAVAPLAEAAAGETAGAEFGDAKPILTPERVQPTLKPEYLCAEVYPLIGTQRAIYLGYLFAGRGSGAYTEQFACRITGDLDVSLLQRAWQGLVDRHSILRTGVARQSLPGPVQFVCEVLPAELALLEWRKSTAEEVEAALQAFRREQLELGFELSEPPLYRLAVIRVGDEEHYLVWTYHHLILDGWSEGLLLDELLRTYQSLAAGEAPCLAPPRPFRDYVAWQCTKDMADAEAFWRSRLAGFSAPTALRSATPNSDEKGGDGGYDTIERVLPLEAIRAACQRHGLTVNTLLEGLWACLIGRDSGQDDIVYGSVASGRQAGPPGIESMVGLFVGMLPMRVAFEQDLPVLEWFRSFQEDLAESRHFEYAPPELLRRAAALDNPRDPLFNTAFVNVNFGHIVTGETSCGAISLEDPSFISAPHYPLTLFAVTGADLRLRFVYAKAEFEPATVETLVERYLAMIDGIDLDAEVTIGDFLGIPGTVY